MSKKEIKALLKKGVPMVAFVMIGVIGAGWVINQFASKVEFLKNARKGFDA